MLPVDALTGFCSSISELADDGDVSMIDSMRSAASSRLARYLQLLRAHMSTHAQTNGKLIGLAHTFPPPAVRVLRTRTGEEALHVLKMSREVLEELAAGLEER